MKEEDKTFVRITNRDIFDKLIKIEDHVKETNGTVKSHSQSIVRLWWVLGGAIMIGATAVIALI